MEAIIGIILNFIGILIGGVVVWLYCRARLNENKKTIRYLKNEAVRNAKAIIERSEHLIQKQYNIINILK